MTSLRISQLSFSYRDSVEVLARVSLHLTPGWTGVVGANGSGKSTLLGLLAGELAPTSGTVLCEPEGVLRHLCPQRVDAPSAAVRELAESWSKTALRWQSRLALDPAALARWPTLSPGERKRWQIGAALAARPDVLLLDEPTNHVDAATRELLASALASFRGIGIVVSHDRALLETLTTATILVRDGSATLYRGAYGQARAQWEAAAERQREAHAAANQRLHALERRLHDRRRDEASAAASINVSSRSKGPRDSDARTLVAKERVKYAQAALSRSAAVLRNAVDRATEDLAQYKITKERGRSLFIGYEPPRKQRLLWLDTEVLYAGEQPLLHEVHAAVMRDSRIHLCGPNGTGKTTLVQGLLASSTLPEERLLYIPQVLPHERVHDLWQRTRALDPRARGRVLQAAAALGLDPERALASDHPSPGEARKLFLAWGLGLHAWLLVLDEPTNHLDLPSIERLQAALADYPGALLLVTHDSTFAEPLTSTLWTLDAGRMHVPSRTAQDHALG